MKPFLDHVARRGPAVPPLMRLVSRARRFLRGMGDRGVTVVEFAMVAPVLGGPSSGDVPLALPMIEKGAPFSPCVNRSPVLVPAVQSSIKSTTK